MKKMSIMAVFLLILTAALLFAGGGSEAEPKYKEISPKDLDKEFTRRSTSYSLGEGYVTETGIEIYPWGYIMLIDVHRDASTEGLNEPLLKERIESNKKYKVYLTTIEREMWTSPCFRVDRIDGLMPVEEAQARIDQRNAEKMTAEKAERDKEEARRQNQEKAINAEQERLANLYKQAGNNFGNLRNTSRRYGFVFGNDYLTTIINFGDGNYIKETQSALGWGIFAPSPETGTYRVNGDTVIFLSSKGEYEAGTIVGTALNIGGSIYR